MNGHLIYLYTYTQFTDIHIYIIKKIENRTNHCMLKETCAKQFLKLQNFKEGTGQGKDLE